MNIIMSIAWQATGFILLCLTFIVIVLNCTVFADDIEESENWDEKK